MKSFPMFIKTTGRKVVIVGGGEPAAQKLRLILKTDAKVIVAAPVLDPEIAELVRLGRVEWYKNQITADFFGTAAFAFIASGCPGFDASIHAIAKSAGCAVNVVDQPDLCDLITPSILDRDPVVVAIGTEGTAPVLARQIKTKLEEGLPQNLGGLAALGGRLRSAVAERVPRSRRREFWRWVFTDTPRRNWDRGRERVAAQIIKEAIATGGAPTQQTEGHISLVGAGPGAKDLLTLRAVQRLQEADIIFYDRLVESEVLELARRDAERVFVGKVVGANAWPQDRINALIISEARKGRRVVRLKSGDPGIFGRAGEELRAAELAGIECEVVPGVTAACAASASIGMSLTERGVTNALVLGTGAVAETGDVSEVVSYAKPGASLCIYMGCRVAETLQAQLIQKGMPHQSKVHVVIDATRKTERKLAVPLSGLAETLKIEDIRGQALLMLTWPLGVTSEQSQSSNLEQIKPKEAIPPEPWYQTRQAV